MVHSCGVKTVFLIVENQLPQIEKIVWLRRKNRLAQKIKGEKRTVKDSI